MFITFEGIEGSGKSTQVDLLKNTLEKIHFDVVATREPGWGRVGSLIRKIILDYDDIEIEPIAELSLFCADRAQHVQEFIRPKLSEGKIVLCDRFYDSTIAYQGYGRGLDPEMVKNGTFASPAIARASNVFPVPGGPTSKTPFGIFPPRRWNLPGSFKNSTTSSSSVFASSMPATSSNVTRP